MKSGLSRTMTLMIPVFSALLLISACSNELLESVRSHVVEANTPEDLTAPTGSVTINGGATYSISTSVTLGISSTDTGGGVVQDMEIRNDTAFTGNWQSYSTSLGWSLNGPDGADPVYIRFRDDSGNISDTYSDSIILDRIAPTITERSPASGASNVPRISDVAIDFSEAINQSTWEAAVSLSIKGGSGVDIDPDSDTDSVWLMPTSDLLYGYDYSIEVTSGVTDLAGNPVSNPGTTDFTVERDYWEGLAGNNSPGTAFSMDSRVPRSPLHLDTWFDMVPDNQYEEWSFPTGVHSKLALLEGIDYYTIDPPDDAYLMDVRVLFTNDESNGTTLASAGSDSLTLYISNGGQGYSAFLWDTHATSANERWYELDLSGRTGPFTILVYESSSTYTNRRKYNLRLRFATGM